MSELRLQVGGKTKSVNVPDSWSEISVKKYSDLLAIDQTLNPLEKRMQTVQVMLEIDQELIEQLYKEDFEKIEEMIQWVYEPMPPSEATELVVEGETFHLYTDFNKMTMGEQVSIDILVKKSGGDLLNVYDELLCLFLRKKDASGKFETWNTDMMERKEMFGKVPIMEVNQLLLFFSNGEKV